MFFKKRHYHGFSLLEILLVLAVAAALVIGAFVIYPKISASQRANTESNNITTIANGIRSLYSGSANVGSLNNTVVINANIAPDTMIQNIDSTNKKIINGFKGEVLIYGDSSSHAMQIRYPSVPNLECSKIMTQLARQFDVSAIINSDGDLYTIYNSGNGGLNVVINYDVSRITGACSGDNNTLVFMFYS